jgi:FkbM family methyltransferase
MSARVNLIEEIGINHFQHSRTSKWWIEANEKYTSMFSKEFNKPVAKIQLGSLDELRFRDINFGAVTSAHLFGLDELIIFTWYQMNSMRYRKTLDLGANIGVHSTVVSKFGFEVTSYEPDPIHIDLFRKTIEDNSVENLSLRKKAIGTNSGKLSFTRVLGNTTGSHLTGSKKNLYGELDVIEVEVDSFQEIISEGYDFIKMDVEGYEVKLISKLKSENFSALEIMLEIGTSENASEIFTHIQRLGINAFSQKNNWKKVEYLEDLPTSHKEGSLFLSSASSMNWNT